MYTHILSKNRIYQLNTNINNFVYIMRDDLLPFSFGGNKVRKAEKFFKDILRKKCNCVVTYGSINSNHCRIIANYCAKYDLKCEIISPEGNIKEKTNNYYLNKLFGAKINICKLENVKETINEIIEQNERQGYKVYFIEGGGHGNLGTQAYVDAYKEIYDFEKKNKIKFDYIFHASGTGTTQAGLIIGNYIYKDKAKIIGISIARKEKKGIGIISKSIKDYCEEKKLKIPDNNINFVDDYILEGYGMYNNKIEEVIKEILINEGIPLDTTYTGKAFWGMKEHIKKYNIEDKNILFIHTGGAPIFFDYLNKKL